MKDTRCCHAGCKNVASTFAVVANESSAPTKIPFCSHHVKDLGMDYLLPNLASFDPNTIGTDYEECRLHTVLFQYEPERFLLILKNVDTRSVLVVPTSYDQAMAVVYALDKIDYHKYPTTHSLIVIIMNAAGASPLEAVVYNFEPAVDAYSTNLTIKTQNSTVNVHCRISDAVAISVREKIPIKINKTLLGRDVSNTHE